MFEYQIGYNRTMENNEDKCKTCGRPWKFSPKCNYCDPCLNEYCGEMPACIKKQKPDCMAKAVIPAITTDTVEGLTNLANCFVHVTSINTTFYIDDKHRPMIIWAGDVEVSLPDDVQTDEQWIAFIRSFKLRSQTLRIKFFSQDAQKNVVDIIYFDKTGRAYFVGEAEEMTEV